MIVAIPKVILRNFQCSRINELQRDSFKKFIAQIWKVLIY